MKRINLRSRETFFPLKKKYQWQIVVVLFLLITLYNGLDIYADMKRSSMESTTRDALRKEMESLRLTLVEKKAIDDKFNYIEREFAAVAADYEVLRKNSVIRNVFERLSEIMPHNAWLTAVEFEYDNAKFLRVAGKSLEKNEIFVVLKNCGALGKNAELVNMQSENGGSVFIFEIRLELA